MEEIWKDVPGYEGRYQVSDLGRVRSVSRIVYQKSKGGTIHAHHIPGKILKPRRKGCGHTQVQLGNDGNFLVHRLVMLAFVGPCPVGMEVCHNDSNPANNDLSNLRYDTRHSNRVDMIFVGNQGRQKLHVSDVLEIKQKLSKGAAIRDLASEYGVCYNTIWNISKERSFKCLNNT